MCGWDVAVLGRPGEDVELVFTHEDDDVEHTFILCPDIAAILMDLVPNTPTNMSIVHELKGPSGG